ncbi:MBL fold metallo-hydrolase [Salinibacillus xinjiangensis]|uniref:MBL fold metallo-hydrolase n=1 Tax=Salinibacillus xinjiangensis TaxID=1229268 RepID=A0A6G1X6E0_9BACI|nr:MBL fold metallo-hydrolase [Salinibacillus xinjiangensis]MRG86534.1 MBL fold metallo-hydrolase [Salinibacillus xinjiangensis]
MKVKTYKDIEMINIAVHPIFQFMFVNLFYVDGLLIDSGPRLQKHKLSPIFRKWDIEQVAVTHHHSDHIGLAPWLMKHKNVQMYSSYPTQSEDKVFGAKSGWTTKANPFPNVIKTPKYRFHPISTPGHTPDHVSILEPNKGWLFSGDLYVTPYPKVFLKEESVSAYIESLKKIKTLDFDTLFCGHGGVIQNGKEMIGRKLNYLEKVRIEVLRLHELGYSDRAIVKKLFPKKARIEVWTFGSFSRLHLVRSCYQ